LNFTLTTIQLLPEPSNRPGWLRILLCQCKTLSRTVPALSPQVDGVKIEHACVGVRLWEAAFDQVRQQLVEASEGEV
jgi:hypothetical protein